MEMEEEDEAWTETEGESEEETETKGESEEETEMEEESEAWAETKEEDEARTEVDTKEQWLTECARLEAVYHDTHKSIRYELSGQCDILPTHRAFTAFSAEVRKRRPEWKLFY